MRPRDEVDRLRRALLELTPSQQLAVEALIGGATHQVAADAAGVSRETVSRWAHHSPAFRASLNLYRYTLVAEQIDLARRIRGKALTAVENAVEDGKVDPLAVLRVLGESKPAGPTVAQKIVDDEVFFTQFGYDSGLPPTAHHALLDHLETGGLSSDERAAVSTILRLAEAAGIGPTDPEGDP